jgi:hypothetical protein
MNKGVREFVLELAVLLKETRPDLTDGRTVILSEEKGEYVNRLLVYWYSLKETLGYDLPDDKIKDYIIKAVENKSIIFREILVKTEETDEKKMVFGVHVPEYIK